MRKFIDKYKNRIFLVSVLIFLVHFSKISSGVIGIDTENLIKEQRKFYRGWLDIGRYGLVFLKQIFGGYDRFNPYFAGMMTVIFLAAAVLLFLYLWEKVSGNVFKTDSIKATAVWAAAAILWAAHPVITEQLYFSLQSMEICFAIILTGVTLICIRRWQRGNRTGASWWYKLLPLFACVCLIVSFATYQSFVELYIFGTVTVAFLNGINTIVSDKKDVKWQDMLRPVLPYFLVFLIAFLGNMALTGLFSSGSSYLSEQVEWGNAPVTDIIISIFKQMAKTVTGVGSLHYDFTFGILTIFTIALVSVLLIKCGNHKGGCAAVMIFYMIALIMTPYLMLIVCGGNAAVRSQLVLPALTGFYAYVDLNICIIFIKRLKNPNNEKSCNDDNQYKKDFKGILIKAVSAALCFVCAAAAWRETSVTEALYYTEKMCYEQDVYIARELVSKIDITRGHNWYPVVVIGTYDYKENNSSVVGETIGHSFFDHDADTEPRFYWSTRRVLGLMHVLGYNYEQVTEPDMIAVAMEDSLYMPEWPNEGCVQVHDDMIIIKMSNFED